jgi:hypothetical protein
MRNSLTAGVGQRLSKPKDYFDKAKGVSGVENGRSGGT